jgi:hypothetical protein
MTTPRTIATPYADAAPGYQIAGWSPLPIPYGEKAPPPAAWTGYGAPMASFADVTDWAANGYAAYNVAVRMPETALGVDVDAYGNKPAMDTMLKAIGRLGALPRTFISTSRDDGVSGIRYYRVPAGRCWANVLGAGVEIVSHHARYAVVAPSLHPEGMIYRWLGPDGKPFAGTPALDDLPELPAAWIDDLDRGEVADRPGKANLADADVIAWLGALHTGDPCRYMTRLLQEATELLGDAASRHDDVLRYVGKIVRGGDQGHLGATTTLDTLQGIWLDSLKHGKARTPTRHEWSRMVVGAVALSVRTPTLEADKGCCAESPEATVMQPPAPATLDQAHSAYLRWFGDEYDLVVLDAVLAVAAAEKLTGDPAWLLLVGGPGATKTETVSPLARAGGQVTSTITSEGALLSGTAKRERDKNATGGLLRKLGDSGLLVIKDVTSILSMSRDARSQVLAAIREVYDGRWERNLGVDGGKTLTWTGRIVVIGAVTTAWDKAHSVVAAMGDRFLLVRMDSTKGRVSAGTRAIANTGDEIAMRAELAEVVAGVLATVNTDAQLDLSPPELDQVLAIADLVTLARTAVERDYRGDVIDAHAPEMPTRFAKQLTQVIRGALALGMSCGYALHVATRCAADSMPPLRLAVLLYLQKMPHSTTHSIRKGLDMPRATVDRELQALHLLGLVTVDEIAQQNEHIAWYYTVNGDEHHAALALLASARFVFTHAYAQVKTDSGTGQGGAANAGTTPTPPTWAPNSTPGSTCRVCGLRLSELLRCEGHDTHPSCDRPAA